MSKSSILEQEHERLHRHARITFDLGVSAKSSSVAAPMTNAPLSTMRREEVDMVLAEYQDDFGSTFDKSIVASKQGETQQISTNFHPTIQTSSESMRVDPQHRASYPTKWDLIKECHMRPKKDIFFRVDVPNLDDIMIVMLGAERSGFLTQNDWNAVKCIDSGYNEIVDLAERVRDLDFSPLRQERLDYASQKEISQARVDMAAACLFHYGGEVGSLVRYCGKEFIAAHRDPDEILAAVRGHINDDDYEQMERILREGCPSKFTKFYSKENKIKMMERGNCKSVDTNQDIVASTMNKEDRNSHLITLPAIICRFCPYAHHVGQTMNMKKENARLCWDGSNKDAAEDWAMNDDVDMDDEPLITFGNTKLEFMKHLYNLRISYPHDEIWLATADIKACFRWPKLHPDITGAFGFVMGFLQSFFLMTAMVFGFRASANSWEPFRRAIEALTAVFFVQFEEDISTHQEFIDLLRFDELPPPGTEFVQAKPCSINRGCFNKEGKQLPIGTNIYVDDCLIAAVNYHMRRLLRSVIEAIFVVCGRPDTKRRQCSLAMDKWEDMLISYYAILLGLLFNTRTLTVSMTKEYLAELRLLIKQTWHKGRKAFYVNELEVLLGKCARLGEAANWVYHLMTHLYSSAAFALRENREFLGSNSPNFIAHLKKIKELRKREQAGDTRENIAHINFAMKKSAQSIHRSKCEYYIGKDMRAEIDFIAQALEEDSEVKWETPIAHMIKRDPTAQAHSDACLDGGGGYSIALTFFWYMTWSTAIYHRTKKFIHNDSDKLFISINVLEFASVIINYCAALTVIETLNVTDDPWPVLLAWCDNTSSVRWVTHACMKSEAGRALGRFFCALLMNSRLGINSKWISTEENFIADDISRLKQLLMEQNPTNPHPSIDYSILFQKYPQLRTCKRFVPSDELISCIECCLLERSCPSLERISRLKQAGLGRLISSSGCESTD